MKHIKLIGSGLIICVTVFAVFHVRIVRKPRNVVPMAERTLENVEFRGSVSGITFYLWKDYKIPAVVEYDDDSDGNYYSAKATTVQKMLDAVVPKEKFIWREERRGLSILSRNRWIRGLITR